MNAVLPKHRSTLPKRTPSITAACYLYYCFIALGVVFATGALLIAYYTHTHRSQHAAKDVALDAEAVAPWLLPPSHKLPYQGLSRNLQQLLRVQAGDPYTHRDEENEVSAAAVSLIVLTMPTFQMGLNCIYSMIKHGGVKTFIAATFDVETQQACQQYRLPCYDASDLVQQYSSGLAPLQAMALINQTDSDEGHRLLGRLRLHLMRQIIDQGYHLHVTDADVVYVRDIYASYVNLLYKYRADGTFMNEDQQKALPTVSIAALDASAQQDAAGSAEASQAAAARLSHAAAAGAAAVDEPVVVSRRKLADAILPQAAVVITRVLLAQMGSVITAQQHQQETLGIPLRSMLKTSGDAAGSDAGSDAGGVADSDASITTRVVTDLHPSYSNLLNTGSFFLMATSFTRSFLQSWVDLVDSQGSSITTQQALNQLAYRTWMPCTNAMDCGRADMQFGKAAIVPHPSMYSQGRVCHVGSDHTESPCSGSRLFLHALCITRMAHKEQFLHHAGLWLLSADGKARPVYNDTDVRFHGAKHRHLPCLGKVAWAG